MVKNKQYKTGYGTSFLLGALLYSHFIPVSTSAETLSMTVTPAFFRISLDPGETWTSYIEVGNEGTGDTEAHVVPMDFDVTENDGAIKYTPLIDGGRGTTYSAAEWIVLEESKSTLLSPKESLTVPFTIEVPENAEPGGYYVGLLVGDQVTDPGTQAQLRVANLITSLIYVNVTGEIFEKGRIREFYSEKSLYDIPEARFILRFENKGTVHLIPEGVIRISNMWGKERGELAVGGVGETGVVLPGSMEEFVYPWEGDVGVFEYGRYKAVATIAYGADGVERVMEVRHFWVLPTKVMVTIGVPFLLMIAISIFLIKRYIRRTVDKKRSEIHS